MITMKTPEQVEAELTAIFKTITLHRTAMEDVFPDLIALVYEGGFKDKMKISGKTLFISMQGRPVPYVRMTQGQKWTDAAKRYRRWSKDLACVIRKGLPWLALYKKAKKPVIISVCGFTIPENGIHGDRDNYEKAFQDAVQHAGFIDDDKEMKAGEWYVLEPDKAKTGTYAAVTILD